MFTVYVYIDNGRTFSHDVKTADNVREYASAIVATGYCYNDGKIFEHYPPHRILKVTSSDIPTK